MTEVLPEAIRGAWYFSQQGIDPHNPKSFKQFQQLFFHLDGNFTRFHIRDGRRREHESGDYTFDGKFLIMRGRNTDTFRVDASCWWRWELEEKKKPWRLLRGRFTEEDFLSLDDEQCQEIRILPIRVAVRHPLPDDDNRLPLELIFKSSGGDETTIGALSYEREPDGSYWVAISSLLPAGQIHAESWRRIVRESLFDIFMGAPEDVETLRVQLLAEEEQLIVEI